MPSHDTEKAREALSALMDLAHGLHVAKLLASEAMEPGIEDELGELLAKTYAKIDAFIL